MSVELNVFYNRLAVLRSGDLAPGNLAALFAMLKEARQIHAGIAERAFFRDRGWSFCQTGRYLEHADQTTRLLDLKYRLLLHCRCRLAGRRRPVECAAAFGGRYHADRRLHPASTNPARVAGLVVLNTVFPRSVSLHARGRPITGRGQVTIRAAAR